MAEKIVHPRKEYLLKSIDVSDVMSDPFSQFDVWYKEALQECVDEPNAMVLSTATSDGKVSARVVLLKGLENNSFVFYTNYYSRKGLQINSNPFAALTFHWKELERQVRIEGLIKKTTRKESQIYFNQRPLESRLSACISPQSAVIPDRAFLEAMRDGVILDLGGAEPKCPSNWGGYRLIPHLAEFWQGRENRLHDRIQYTLTSGKWVIERLAP